MAVLGPAAGQASSEWRGAKCGIPDPLNVGNLYILAGRNGILYEPLMILRGKWDARLGMAYVLPSWIMLCFI